MKCKAVQQEIEEVERQVAVSAEARAHLSACASCKAFADERASLRALIGSLESVSAPPDFDWKLRARLIEARGESERSRTWRAVFTPNMQTLALAASFVFMVVAVVVYQQTRLRSASAPQAASTTRTDERVEASAKTGNEPSITSQEQAGLNSSSEQLKPESNGSTRVRSVKSLKAGGPRNESQYTAASQRIFSNDFGSRSAQDFSPGKQQSASADAGPVISVPVRSNKSARLQFEDGQGTKRTLSPVNFGGQELIERPDSVRLIPASEKGIW